MSDPVSNAEIEDVLSSIRRLVSNGEHEKTEGAAAVVEQAEDRLVLTPALRVDAARDPEPESPENGEADHDDDPAEEAHPHCADSPGGEAAEYDHAPVDEPAEDTHDEGDAERRDTGDAPRQDTEGAEDTPSDFASSHDPEHDAETEARDQAETANVAPLEDRIAEVEAAVAARDDEWEPDGDSADPYSGSDVTPMAWEDYAAEPQHEAEEPDPAPEVATLVLDREGWQAGAEQSDGENGARAADTDARPDPDARPEPGDAEESGRGLWSEDDAVIDEEALRDMVSEIVRQELQGALGERITRNVRKLVRREIHRALTSQDFD